MKTEPLGKVVQQIAKPIGYRRRSGLLWRSYGELTTLVHLQRSQWSGGMYVNLGVIPTKLILKAAPPGPGYWPIQERAADLESPHQEKFRELEQDDDDTMQPEEMVEAFSWLLAWMSDNFGDAERVRSAVVGAITLPLITSHHDAPPDGEWILVDWARGKLKRPSHYYPGTPYYR